MKQVRAGKTGCSCPKCVECCFREPGWFIPSEVLPAATFLKMKEPEFLAKYCEEHPEDGVLAVSPQKKRRGECVFLSRGDKCLIHPVKPYECRKVYGCEGASRHRRIREIIKKQWK